MMASSSSNVRDNKTAGVHGKHSADLSASPGDSDAALTLKMLKEMYDQQGECGTESTNTSPCRLCKTLVALDEAVAVKQGSLKERILSDARTIVSAAVKIVREEKKLFETSVHLKGSMKTDLKVGRPDEIDFLVELPELTVEKKNNWNLKKDSASEAIPHRIETPDIGLESCFQLYHSSQQNQQLHSVHSNCMKTISNFSEYLDAESIKDWFTIAVDDAFKKLQGDDLGSLLSTREVQFAYDRASGVLLLFPTYTKFAVKIDINPCIRFVTERQEDLLLVPSGKHNTWRLANIEPPELQYEVVKQAIRVLKTLRDINEKQSGGFTRVRYHALLKIRNKSTSLPLVSDIITRQVADATIRPFTTAIPSYTVIGSVVQAIRNSRSESLERSLCKLVLKALQDFELTDPNGNPVPTTKSDKFCARELLTTCASQLYRLNASDIYVQDLIKRELPLYYSRAPPNPLRFTAQTGPPRGYIDWVFNDVRSDDFVQWLLEHYGRGLRLGSLEVLQTVHSIGGCLLYIAVHRPALPRLHDLHRSVTALLENPVSDYTREGCLDALRTQCSQEHSLRIRTCFVPEPKKKRGWKKRLLCLFG